MEPRLINEVCIDDIMISSFCDLCNKEFCVSPEKVLVQGECFCSEDCKKKLHHFRKNGYPDLGEEGFSFWAGIFRKKKLTQTIKEKTSEQTERPYKW